MKKIISALMAVLIVAQLTTITSFASEESATDLYKRDPDAFYKKYMCLDDEAEEEGLYSDANNGAFTKRKKSEKTSGKKSQSSASSYSYTGEAHGYVYSVDELHIVGLPTNPNTGYTQAGNYGRID